MASALEKNELKVQGVVEAAQDPESNVSADDAQKKIVEESKKAGITAFTFDPDASPEEKRRQAAAAVPAGFHSQRTKGISVVTDVADSSAPVTDLPPPTKEGVIELPKDKDGNTIKTNDPQSHDEEPYTRTGWAPRFGWPADDLHDAASLLDHSTWLESNIPDKFYGDWYHNAAIIAFACISSWLVAVLGGGLGWVFILMAVCSTYYRTSIRRVRRNFRDDINRELSLKKLETETESLEWINSFMLKFWPIYQPVLAQTIINSVDQVLSGATPAFLDSLKLKTFTLGSKPPRMEHVKTYPKAGDDTVIMDWKFSFTPNDTADMTSKQVKNKINPKVVLEIRVGKAMISKGLDVIVEDMSFSGIMQLKIKLQIPFPHIEKVEMCFLEKPTIDYVCKPLGGETFGFDINFIPGLESFILEQIHGNLAPMMYSPNVFPIEVAKMLAGTPVDQAIGVVAVTLHGAQGLKNPDNFSGSPDPYAALTLNRRQQLARTKHVKDTGNPRWNETHYIIITSFNDSLDIQVFDYNDFRKHKELGVASFALDQVEELAVHENEVLEVIADGKARGQLSCDIRFFPVMEPKKLEDGSLEPPPDSNTGILRFTVEQAKDLDGTKSLVGLLNPYATLHLNGRDVHSTKKLKRTNNPIWDNGSKEMLITDKKNAKLGVTIKDDRDLTGDQVIGKYQIKLEDMLECMGKSQEWFHLSGVATGRVKMMAQWKPVALSGVVGGTGGYVTPVGVMRFHFKNAKDLRNFETLGKSDPYVRVLLSGIEKARTVTHKNTLDPDFDEVLYVPVHSARERLTLEVMDSEKMGKDRSLGLIEVFAGDYISQAENGEYNVHDQKKMFQGGLQLHGKGIAKGVLTYTVSFFPCLNVADPEDEEEEAQAAAAAKAIEDAPRSSEAGKFSSSMEKKTEEKKDGAELEISPPKTPVTPVSPTMPRKSKDESGPPKIRLSPQELLKYESGLLIFKLMEAEMPEHNTHLEVWVDDMAFPSYTSSAAKHKKHAFDEIGDCFIRELDFSRLTLKVREKGDKVEGSDKDKDHTIAKLQGNTLDTLKQCLNNPTTLKLKDKENRPSSVKVSLKYIPVKMQLDPSESINNMGTLRVDVLDAQDLPSADSNGKSDPYCKFELNGEDVYKTKVQKKTLHPAWNEFFEVPVPSRTAAKFKVTVWDYDFADKPDFLGAADINLEQLDPFRPSESRLILDGKSGTVRLRMLFRPSYVTRTRQGTSTFSGTFAAPGRIVTGIAGAPIKVGSTVGHGVGKGASFLKRGLFSRKEDDADGASSSFNDIPTIVENGGSPPGPTPGLGLKRATGFSTSDGSESPDTRPGTSNGSTLGGHARKQSNGAASVHSLNPGSPGSGSASFTVVSATGFPPSTDLYITINQLTPKPKAIGKTKHHKDATGFFRFNETFKTTCTPDTQFKIEAKGEHTLRSDDDLGEALYFVDETGTGAEKEIKVGSGTVIMKSTFVASASTLDPDSPKSIVRRSFMSKRESRSREGTPS
ncbi:C2 domain-containing protein [Colletotrichum abscissum]|uniref:C2 domain-containing protein n=1 Tax=Colletotrichum abscissum TaxID=1671311 RepID=A0A9P9XAP2_9PEZI|nr:C2 domain-containing protein [Colletotrichum abscissum]KAI3531569.1 C2 domain-containing protein [Colletotrichum filicis]KAI3544734.1 C2 domain-containing protein [Colletotrichum abscissum]KAK1483296.1 C2 domain-containing protein [Colletotrichum abscissum]